MALDARFPMVTASAPNFPSELLAALPASSIPSAISSAASPVPSICVSSFDSCVRVVFTSAVALFSACCHRCTSLLFSS